MNAAGITYLPEFIREKLESRQGLQALSVIPVKTAFTTPSTLFDHGVSADTQPLYHDFHAGDVRYSLADVDKAQERTGYKPAHCIRDGLQRGCELVCPSHRVVH
jgi:nucleoside-diphosphate-sugar epimerase